jgi:hypothetical protein
MILWRPVGLREMRLVFESGMRAFPPRLADQPFFYPVLDAEYAEQIARDWNTKEEPFAGYVLRFEIPDDYAAAFEVHTVGSSSHRELWIAAEKLGDFNSWIQGPIRAERAFFGSAFWGDVPEGFGLKGKDAYGQITALSATPGSASFDFTTEIAANAATIFLNFPFWRAADPKRLGTSAEVLAGCFERMRTSWSSSPKPAPLIEESAIAR